MGEGHVRNIFKVCLRLEAMGAAPASPRVVSKCPVLAAAHDFFPLRIDGYEAGAGCWSDIRMSLLVQRQVPTDKAPGPVSQDVSTLGRPLVPFGFVVGIED